MEKPSWAFSNKTYFNIINETDKRNLIFSDFEHNWDFFQFLTNENKYYFCLNKNISTKYNFDIIYKTYHQKCKHINKENICFIIFFQEQENFLKEYPILLNYLYDKQLLNILTIEETMIENFSTYMYDDALKILNNKYKLHINEENVINILNNKNIIKRSLYNINTFTNICFFGASVTEQQYSYVNYLQRNCNNFKIIKKGYSGCHINQAIWLVDDILIETSKPSICFLEWITSILKPSPDELKCFLAIIVKKLLKNNITPIFLYLYKTDIHNYLDVIHIYEEIASQFNISSLHFYNAIQNIENIDISSILKDTCHTNYEGSNLYGLMLQKTIYQYLFNDDITLNIKNENEKSLIINNNLLNKYANVNVISLDQIIDCNSIENIVFNKKKYYKISADIILNINNQLSLIAINILYYKNNGYIYINNTKIQTWDSNCYYKRYGYINLNIDVKSENLIILISQEIFDTSSCKYEATFPDEKYLWLSELIFI